MAFACAPLAPDVPSQSLLLRGAQVWFHCMLLQQKRTSIACRIAREVGNVVLATQRGANLQMMECPHYRASYKGNFSHYFVAQKASDGEHVRHKDGEKGWRIFKAFAFLCSLPHIDALQATAWVRATVLFVFVSFVLGIRAASASQAHPAHVPVVACTCSLKSSDVEAKVSAISSEVDTALADSAKLSLCVIVDNAIHGDQEHGKASEAEANDNVQCTNPRHTLQDYNYVAYDGYNDSVYKKFEDTFLEGERTQPAPQMMTTVNKSSGANGAIREWREKSVEGQVLEKGFQEWGSACYKLTVPLRVVGLRGSVPPIWLKHDASISVHSTEIDCVRTGFYAFSRQKSEDQI